MKIGILTLPLHTNYGGILQAYALQTVLEQMGHNIVVLDKSTHKRLPLWKMPFSYPKRIIKKFILGENIMIFHEQWNNKVYPIISQYTQKFIETHIHRKEVNDLSKLKEQDFDALIVGSDQIWRTLYYPKIEEAFLSFTSNWKNIIRIAYAPSFGTDIWEYSMKQTRVCKNLIRKFNAVSVRESSAIELCRKYLDFTPVHVLDPTLLLDAADYLQLTANVKIKSQSNMLLQYVLDENEEKEQLVKEIAKRLNLNIIRVNSKVEEANAKLEERIQPPVEEWLLGFHNAQFVITDSFHACAFSIIFNKPFIVYGNKKRGFARFYSLLSLFNLEDRLITDIKEIPIILNHSINWEQVNTKRERLKEFSMSFIKSNLI